MLEFTWKVFAGTGNINTYLLFKELEREHQNEQLETEEDQTGVDFPIT
ncbi:YqzL family protein [Heyndrickxia acidiproducens]|nr:YqzL family protein [Heyndrickxia acidiproducens]